MSMTENVLCTLIGVGGTLLGTIVGLVFPYLCNNFGRKLLVISDADVRFATGKSDGEGGHDGSWINFAATILNKKNQALIIEKIACELYSGSNKITVCACADRDTGKRSAGTYKYDELRYIDVAPKSSITKNIHVFLRGDMTSCDKVVFTYSWGVWKRKQTVWSKEDTSHANT